MGLFECGRNIHLTQFGSFQQTLRHYQWSPKCVTMEHMPCRPRRYSNHLWFSTNIGIHTWCFIPLSEQLSSPQFKKCCKPVPLTKLELTSSDLWGWFSTSQIQQIQCAGLLQMWPWIFILWWRWSHHLHQSRDVVPRRRGLDGPKKWDGA